MRISCLLFFSHLFVASMSAADLVRPPISYSDEIQPLLDENCIKCHGPEKRKGGLRLDHKANAFEGGDSGKRGIVPGHSGQSQQGEIGHLAV